MNVDFGNDIYTIDFADPANGSFAIQPFTTNGPLNPTSVSLAPGATSAATTLTLVGRGLPGWGESVIENMVHMLENFAGPTAPTYMIPGQIWFDNSTDTLNVRNQANDAWLPTLLTGTDLDFGGFKGINVGDAIDPTDAMNQQSSDARYVEIAGDSMTAAANLTFSGGGEVLGLPATPSATGAASKEYVDVTFVDTAGDTMAGTLSMGANFISGVLDPLLAQDVATKLYVDTEIASAGGGLYVNVSGDTMVGFLTLAADPAIGAHAATKTYVDNAVGSVGGDGVVDGGSFDGVTGNGTLTLTRTEALPDVLIANMNAHGHVATQVTYQIAEPGQRLDSADPASAPSYSQDFANFEFDRAAQLINASNKRLLAVGTDFAGATLTLPFLYPVETNRLEVFVNLLGASTGGRKLVADTRGVAVIGLTNLIGVVESTPTGLGAGPFTFTIDVDGGGAAGISIAGAVALLYGTGPTGLVSAMNAEFVSGAVPAFAIFDVEESAILIYSDTTGGASSVVVVDTGLLAALTPEISTLNFTLVTGATLPTGAVPAAWFDVSSTSATYRMWFDDGSTITPAAGGNVLTAVAFTGADTNQDISDAVVTELIGADGDFSLASNSATPVIALPLSAVGAAPDVVDGAVPTGAALFVTQQGVTTSNTSAAGVAYDYSEDGTALSLSTSFTLAGAPAGTDEFEIIRIK